MQTKEFELIFQVNDLINDSIVQHIPSSYQKKYCQQPLQAWVKTNDSIEQFTKLENWYPTCQHFQTLLVISSMSDRDIPAFVQEITCKTYYAICIGEGMLRWMLKCQQEAAYYLPSTELNFLSLPLDRFPLENDSVELVVIGDQLRFLKSEEIKILRSQIYRILKLGGIAIGEW